jgi:hypothetical protein
MVVFFTILISIFCFSSFIFFYLEDFYKNPIKKPLSESALEAAVQTILLLFVIAGFSIIFD